MLADFGIWLLEDVFVYFGVFFEGRARPPLLSPFLSSRELPSCLRHGRDGHFARKKGKEKGCKICCHSTLAQVVTLLSPFSLSVRG